MYLTQGIETEAGIEAGIGIETGIETEIGKEIGIEIEIGTGTETEIEIETERETETETMTEIETETETQTQTQTETVVDIHDLTVGSDVTITVQDRSLIIPGGVNVGGSGSGEQPTKTTNVEWRMRLSAMYR